MLEINIRKPIDGQNGVKVGISKGNLNEALKQDPLKRFKIKIPRGEAIVTVNEWIARSVIDKKVHKFPNNPMVYFIGSVPLKETNQLSLWK